MAIDPSRYPEIDCGCGCGEKIPSVHKSGHPRKYKDREHMARAQRGRVSSGSVHHGPNKNYRGHPIFRPPPPEPRSKGTPGFHVVKFTPSMALGRALGRIEREGWCQGDLVLLVSPNECRYCLTAAVLYGVGVTSLAATGKIRTRGTTSGHGREGDIWRSVTGIGNQTTAITQGLSPGVRRTYLSALRRLREVIGCDDLQKWNDEEGRTADEVLDALRSARELALREEAG